MQRMKVKALLNITVALATTAAIGIPTVMAETVTKQPQGKNTAAVEAFSEGTDEEAGAFLAGSDAVNEKADAAQSEETSIVKETEEEPHGTADDGVLSDNTVVTDTEEIAVEEKAPSDTEQPAGIQVPADVTEPSVGDTAEAAPAEQPEAAAVEEAPAEQPEAAADEQTPADEETPPEVMKTNIHVGRGFYIGQLSSLYRITFADGFSDVMDEIEARYRKGSDTQASNWQDVLSVYILKQQKKGMSDFLFDDSCKEALARTFASMNVKERGKDGSISYTSLTVEDYITENEDTLSQEDIDQLHYYSSKGCTLLCAAATSAKGFITESLGTGISSERAAVVTAAYSLVGKIAYFWGGKSTAIGWDSRWGTQSKVTEAGSDDTGVIRDYGMDCSGFVTWAYINGYKNASLQSIIGHGTADQWSKSTEVTEENAQPGDLVFLQIPDDTSINHVGIIVGQNDNGDWIVAHCNASDDGVVVEEAYSAGFRYIRSPQYPESVK